VLEAVVTSDGALIASRISEAAVTMASLISTIGLGTFLTLNTGSYAISDFPDEPPGRRKKIKVE
jgi:hypothetical protein